LTQNTAKLSKNWIRTLFFKRKTPIFFTEDVQKLLKLVIVTPTSER
jgi:hypothetical protein